jgi:hypothetical protein
MECDTVKRIKGIFTGILDWPISLLLVCHKECCIMSGIDNHPHYFKVIHILASSWNIFDCAIWEILTKTLNIYRRNVYIIIFIIIPVS